jgi:hypothetical protein
VSGGRAYELLLMGLDIEAADQQCDREWAQVAAMVAGGMAYQDAWARIRERYGDCKTASYPSAPAEMRPEQTVTPAL